MTLAAPALALYTHFPWCVRKCPYCDFNSHALHGAVPEQAYLQALGDDLAAQLEAESEALAGRRIASVFLGGGTPSLFSPAAIGAWLERARRALPFEADAEITLEANPGTIERHRFADYRAAGVTRVSLGAQSFAAPQLAVLGRIHSSDETRRAAEELHAAGLDNFNLDLMYALPAQDLAGALADVEAALALQPAHLSHYQLTLEPGTVFGGRPPPGLPTDDLAAEMQHHCQQRLAEAGFAQYEISAYARPGRQCRHNLNYWRFGDYLGVGAGAHGKLTRAHHIVRTTREREPRRYQAAAAGRCTARIVPEADLPFEFMMNSLRLNEGYARVDFERGTGLPHARIEGVLARLAERQLVEPTASGFRASALGARYLNDLLLEFLPATMHTEQAG
ncbi:MAG TPA: radical SAM family heme chaperone HemW [Steroidobacteraceae bacterium]|nr:radical SAM family heme chaperone HemW [Steroidobacteraceae bacterium]